jgi:subtilisin-like proprotein convertase family protein
MRKLYASPSHLLNSDKTRLNRSGFRHFIKSCYMQPIKSMFRYLFLLMVGLFTLAESIAQTTTLTTNFTNNNGNALVTFNFRNNNTYPVLITDIASVTGTAGDKIVSVFYNTTPVAGSPGLISAANGWQLAATATPNITVASTTANTIVPMISNVGLVIPAGFTYGIAFQVLTSSGGTSLRYGNLTAGTFTFSGGGCDLINGTNVSYGSGVAGTSTSFFASRGFIGSVSFVPYTTCSGTPAPGNTLSSVSSACASVPFSLSLQNGTPQAGLTYQWQSASTASGPWVNIPGAIASSYNATQTNTTFYRCNVTCSGSTGTSTPIQVTMNLPTNCYCAAGANTTAGEKISRVRYIQIDNSSSSTDGYENFTNISTPAFIGGTTPLTVNISGGFAADVVLVWIDFNQDGDFSDPGENVYTSASGPGPHTGNITIPATALLGSTRMRVRLHDSSLGPNATPCGNSSWGQVEDYTVNIQQCIPTTFATQPAGASVACGGNTTFTVSANGSLPAYGWQFRVNATAPWQDVTNTGVYTGATTSTLAITGATSAMNGYQYRALLSGACAALDYSQPATLTVVPLTPVVTPSSTSICNGTIQALSLNNSVAAPTSAVFPSTSGLPLTIPDGVPAGVTNSLNVAGIPAGVVVTNIGLKLNITHAYVGDLVVNLRAPNGQTINLIAALNGGTGGNATANFTNTVIDSISTAPLSGAPAPRTGSFRADKFTATILTNLPTTTNAWLPLLSTLNGNWTLGLCDRFTPDIGTLTSWELQITYTAPVFAQGTWTATPASPNTMFTDAAASVPYTGAPATTIYVRPTVNTNYAVQFTTPGGCTSTVANIPVSVSQPIVGLNVSPASRSVCVGGSTSFSATATSGGPLTYQWAVSTDNGTTYNNLSGATGATLNLTGVTQSMNGNRYRVTATAGPCGSIVSTGVGILTVNPLPVVNLTTPMVKLVPGRTTTLTATSNPPAAANGFAWTLNNAPITGTGNTQVANIDRLGTYQVTVTDVNGCVNKSNPVTIFAEGSDRVWIYPNPTSGVFQVRLYHSGERAEKRVVTIYNTIGQVIESKEFILVAGMPAYYQMNFDLSGGATARGAYVVKVADQYSGRVVSGLVMVQ